MPNTYTQIHIHAVFVVKTRACLIQNSWKDELYRYLAGIIQNHGHKVLIINGMPDHVHILIGMRPHQSLSDLMRDIKSCSTSWINDKGFLKYKFLWQEGFGAFSYSKKDIANVIEYIYNQELHHKKKTFTEEYIHLLEQQGIQYDARYIFSQI